MDTYLENEEKPHLGWRVAKGVYLVFEGVASAAVAVLVVATWFISASWPQSRH
jgi:hypothetical protein